MITTVKNYGDFKSYKVECDDCGLEELYEEKSWGDLMCTMELDGWHSVKSHGEWKNHCGDCE